MTSKDEPPEEATATKVTASSPSLKSPDVISKAAPWFDKKLWLDPIRLEVTARLTATAFLSYCLGIADNLDHVIPPSQASLVGWAGAFFATMFPNLMFGICMANLGVMFQVFWGASGATIMLCAVAGGGKGAFTAVAAAWLIWVGMLRVVRPQMGFVVPILYVNALLTALGTYEKVDEADDGMALVRQFWTESGTENPTAVFQNTLIGWAWVTLVSLTAASLWPWRTVRSRITRSFLPSVLEDVTKLIRLQMRADLKNKNNNDHGTSHTEEASVFDDNDGGLLLLDRNETCLLEEKLVERLRRSALLLNEGQMAVLTTYEPQLLRCGAPVASFLVLKQLMVVTRRMILNTLGTSHLLSTHLSEEPHKSVINQLEWCAQLLREFNDSDSSRNPLGGKNDNGTTDTKDPPNSSKTNKSDREVTPGDEDVRGETDNSASHRSKEQENHNNNDYDPLADDPFALQKWANKVQEAVLDWNRAMAPVRTLPTYAQHNSWKAFKLNSIPWLSAWVGYYKILLWDIPLMALKPQNWANVFDQKQTEGVKFWSVVKFSVGVVILLIMQVYWDAWNEFSVPTSDPPGSHWDSWALIGFLMTSTPTTEGSFKKGIMRSIGTTTGGLSGWLALLATNEGNDEYNSYGLVAWLAVTSCISIFLGFENGFMPALSADHGYAHQNFILTQGTIVFYAANGAGTRNDLVVNRVVANLVGIGMGIFFALLPPQVLAGCPHTALRCLKYQEQNLVRLLHFVLDRSSGEHEDEESLEENSKLLQNVRLTAEISQLYAETDSWVKDASKLKMVPFLQVDPKLKHALSRISINNGRMEQIQDIIEHILSKKRFRSLLAPGQSWEHELSTLAESVETQQYLESSEENDNDNAKAPEEFRISHVDLEDHALRLLHRTALALRDELRENRKELLEVRYGVFNSNYQPSMAKGTATHMLYEPAVTLTVDDGAFVQSSKLAENKSEQF